jgi:cation diffusion facilitator family transporter
MPTGSSRTVVYTAIFANIAIASAKYAAAFFTHSSAMLAEAFHSTADCGNELLLVIGMKRSARPPDPLHPYGHGKVLYFYSLLVAVYIFGIGGVVAFYHGITRLRHPESSTHIWWNFGVLAFSATFDLYSWMISYRELVKNKRPDETAWDEIIASKDPVIFTVFLEDTAGIVGAVLAFLGILLDSVFGTTRFDPIASILIAILLTGVALLLGRESGALLVGERTERGRIRRVRQILENDPAVEAVGDVLTMQLGPEEVLLTVDIRFKRDLEVPDLESAIDRLEAKIRQAEPSIKRIFIEADSLKPMIRSKPRAA